MIQEYRIHKIMRIDYNYEYILRLLKRKESNTSSLQLNLSSLRLSTLQLMAVPLFIVERKAIYFVLLYIL